MGLSSTVDTALSSATAPESTKPVDQSNPFKDYNLGDGSDKIPDGHGVFNEVTDPGSKEQETLYKLGNQARNNFNTEALEQAQNGANLDKNRQFGMNIPIDNPFADYNNLSFEQTQRLSRLADAYNSQRRWVKGNADPRTGIATGHWEQNPQIQTEEMRRMGMTRQGLEQQQSQMLSRENTMLSYPQRLTEMFDKMGMDADAAAMDIQRNFADYAQRTQYDEKFRATFDQALRKDMEYWTQHFAVYMKSEVGRILYNEIKSNPGYASWIATQLTNYPTPSGQQYLAQMIEAQIMRSDFAKNMDPTQITADVMAILGRMTGYTSWNDQYWAAKAAGQGVSGAAAAVTKK